MNDQSVLVLVHVQRWVKALVGHPCPNAEPKQKQAAGWVLRLKLIIVTLDFTSSLLLHGRPH